MIAANNVTLRVGKKALFEDVNIKFTEGNCYGLIGANGAGKSTLLRIMAGIDTEIEGEARPQPGIKIGYLPQEPQLNPEHTVRESVEEAVAEVVNALKGLDEVYAKYAEPDADFDKLAAQQGKYEEIIQAHDGHNLNVQLERAADALRLPDWDAKIANLSGGERRRVALCRLLLAGLPHGLALGRLAGLTILHKNLHAPGFAGSGQSPPRGGTGPRFCRAAKGPRFFAISS